MDDLYLTTLILVGEFGVICFMIVLMIIRASSTIPSTRSFYHRYHKAQVLQRQTVHSVTHSRSLISKWSWLAKLF